MDAVRIEGVSKTFAGHPAVADLDLTVPSGAIYGFIGPNGSGKTTTIRMILHIIHPDSGSIEVLGRRGTRAANDDIGYLPEERGLYRKMSVRRLLAYFASLKGMPTSEARKLAAEWLERIRLPEIGRLKVEALSKGMAQKVQFIAAAISRPKLLILDEPFAGLDPVNLDLLREQVIALRDAGSTIIFSTHDMAAAESLCDSIFMIHRGHKVLDGSPAAIRAQHGGDTLKVSCAGGADALSAISGVGTIHDHGRYIEARASRNPQEILSELAARTAIDHFEIKQPSLHDIFVSIAGTVAGSEAPNP